MQLNQLLQLLSKSENPKVEFKREWYSGANKLDDKGWGEFQKDIIALANGNVGYVGQPAYLIIGTADEDPQPGTSRKTLHISAVGMLSQLQQLRDATLRKLRSTCSPSIPDIEFQFVEVEPNKNVLVIEISPPAGLLKLDRDLNSRGMRFRKGTVFVRVGQDVGVADPTEIDALRREFEQRAGVARTEPRGVLHNLPQRDYVRFVGRTEELARLHKLLHPKDRIWTIVIDGVGGIGKSALALEIAHHYLSNFDALPKEERFDAIIWASAKSATLTADGIVARQQAINTINDIYKTVATTLGEDNIAHDRFEDQNRLVRRALTRQRTLLIIDNLETVDDLRINAFIRELPDPTKCIITTRYRVDVADPIRLVGMSRDDAIALINQECAKKGVQLPDQQADLLYKRTGGLPLAIVWSVAQMGCGYDVVSVLRHLGDAKGDIARYCFEGSVLQIRNKPAYSLLICLALSRSIATQEYLAYVADLSEMDCIEGLVELEKLSLVNRQIGQQTTHYKIHPLVREYSIASMENVPLDKLEKMVLRITERYEPFGAEAISLIEPIFGTAYLSDLKERVTEMVVEQLYRWADYADDYGVGISVWALKMLGTETAIQTLKAVSAGSASMAVYLPYAEQDAITALAQLGEIEYVVNVLPQLLSYSGYPPTEFLVETLGEFGNDQVIPLMDDLLVIHKDNDKLIATLTEAKERIMSKVGH